MNLRINGTPERLAAIKSCLPIDTLTDTILIPQLLKSAQKALLESLRAEIEVYKAFPKDNGKMDRYKFDPTNHKTCFMGQGFKVSNSEFGDADLRDYRKAVGTLHHGVWGNATLLEIWGGDHFDSHREMVKGVFSYCRGDRSTLPTLKFYVFPLFQNKKSGKLSFDDDDRNKALYDYITSLNGMLAEYKKKPVTELTGEYLADFNRIWDRRKAGLEI